MKKLCSAAGCKEIIESPASRCERHTAPSFTPKREYDHHYHNGKQIYKSARWERLRAVVLRQEPLCRSCDKAGYVTEATHVDHIKEIKDGADPWDITNLQPLCHACHNRKTVAEAKKRKRKKNQNGFGSISDF